MPWIIFKRLRLCNSLATIREPVSRNDQLIYISNGLDSDYNAFVTSMNNRLCFCQTPIPLLQFNTHFFVSPALTTNSFHQSILGKPQENPLIHNWLSKPINSLNGPKPECQICGKFGRTALVCYHRANLHYQPPSLKNLILPSLLIPHFQHPLLGLVLLLHLLL